jgi:hypothetical protein
LVFAKSRHCMFWTESRMWVCLASECKFGACFNESYYWWPLHARKWMKP